MSPEENKARVHRMVEELNKRNLAALDEYFAADYVDHSPAPGLPATREGFKQAVTMLFTAFPDFRAIEEDLIAEGDKVVYRGIAQGTHQGEFLGMPPTGKQFTMGEIHIVRLANGQIVEHWEQSDQLGMLQQLGAIPAPGQAG